jgi:hypothetical protein
MELLHATMTAYPAVDYWEILNEQKPPASIDIIKVCQFYQRAMQIAHSWVKRLALFSFSTGTPEHAAWDYALYTGVFEDALVGGDVISLHEYGLWPRDEVSHLLRFQVLYDLVLLPEGYGDIPLYITEHGVPREDWNTTDKMAQLQAYDAQLSALPYVAGAHIYVNPWDPPYSTYPQYYPQYKAYAVSIKDRQNG